MRIVSCPIPRGDVLAPTIYYKLDPFKYQHSTILQLRLMQCSLVLLRYLNADPRTAEVNYGPRISDLVYAYQARPEYKYNGTTPGHRFKLNHMATPWGIDPIIDFIDKNVLSTKDASRERAAAALFAIMQAFRSIDARQEADGTPDEYLWGYGLVSYRIDHVYRDMFDEDILVRRVIYTEDDAVAAENALHTLSLVQSVDWYNEPNCLLGIVRNELARKVRRMILGDPGANPTFKKPFSELEAVQAADALESVLQHEVIRKQFVHSAYAREAYSNEIMRQVMGQMPLISKRVEDPIVKRELALFLHNLLPNEKGTSGELSHDALLRILPLFDGRRDQMLFDSIRNLIGGLCTSRPDATLQFLKTARLSELYSTAVWPHFDRSRTEYDSATQTTTTRTTTVFTDFALQLLSDPYLDDKANLCEARFAPGRETGTEALLVLVQLRSERQLFDATWLKRYVALARKLIERNLAHLQFLHQHDHEDKDAAAVLEEELMAETLQMLQTGIQYDWEVRPFALDLLYGSQIWIDEFGYLAMPRVQAVVPTHGDFVKHGDKYFTFERVTQAGATLTPAGVTGFAPIPPELFDHKDSMKPYEHEYIVLGDGVEVTGVSPVWVDPHVMRERSYLRVSVFRQLYARLTLSNPDIATLMRFPNLRWARKVVRTMNVLFSPLFAGKLDLDKQFRDTTRALFKTVPAHFMRNAKRVPTPLREAFLSLPTIDDNIRFSIDMAEFPARFELLREWMVTFILGDMIGEFLAGAVYPNESFAPGVPNAAFPFREGIALAGEIAEFRRSLRSYTDTVALTERDGSLRVS